MQRAVPVAAMWVWMIAWVSYDLIIPPFLRAISLAWLISNRTLAERLLADSEIAWFLLGLTIFCSVVPRQETT
mgnify:CR=1 FL=1